MNDTRPEDAKSDEELHPIQSHELPSRRTFVAAVAGVSGLAALNVLGSTSFAWATSDYVYPTASHVVWKSFAQHIIDNSDAPGTDYSGGGTSTGSPVVAVKAGTVIYAKTDNSGTYGRQVHIDHGNGEITKYMHLNSVAVGAQANVSQGQVIGGMGGSANGSNTTYGAHIHICLMIQGVYKDFDLYVTGQATGPAQTLRSSVSYDLVTVNTTPPTQWLVNTGSVGPDGLTIKVQLQPADWNVMWYAKFNSQWLTPAQLTQYSNLVESIMPIPPAAFDYAALAQAINDDLAARAAA